MLTKANGQPSRAWPAVPLRASGNKPGMDSFSLSVSGVWERVGSRLQRWGKPGSGLVLKFHRLVLAWGSEAAVPTWASGTTPHFLYSKLRNNINDSIYCYFFPRRRLSAHPVPGFRSTS